MAEARTMEGKVNYENSQRTKHQTLNHHYDGTESRARDYGTNKTGRENKDKDWKRAAPLR